MQTGTHECHFQTERATEAGFHSLSIFGLGGRITVSSGDSYMICAATAGSQHLAAIAHPTALPSHSVRSPLPPDWSSGSSSWTWLDGPLGEVPLLAAPGEPWALWVCNCDNRGPWGSRSWLELCPETLASAVVFGRHCEEPQIIWIWGKWDFPRRIKR